MAAYVFDGQGLYLVTRICLFFIVLRLSLVLTQFMTVQRVTIIFHMWLSTDTTLHLPLHDVMN
jgi:hypothetical protein